MKILVLEGVMTALTSISHIGESYGINSKMRREKIIQPDGTVEEVPIISGNSIRGILRDRGMLHMLKLLGYGVNEETKEVVGLSLPAFYFLFSGGALTKDLSNRGLDIDEARKWRELIPLVSLFGGAMGNQIMPGKAKIGKAIPICEETKHIIPERYLKIGKLQSIWELCQEESYTRRDDEKNEDLRKLIDPNVRGLLEESARAKRERQRARQDIESETGQKQQMRYYVETLAAGTRLFWEAVLEDVNDLEREAFFVTLAEFSRFPYLGGKNGVGHGKVALKIDHWIEIEPRIAPNGRELDFVLGEVYIKHLMENRDRITELLNGLS
ncbi:MAG: RAMP superfamily CRISPR-associated protein [Candidatus Methanomethylicaceae archaeon]